MELNLFEHDEQKARDKPAFAGKFSFDVSSWEFDR